MYLRRRVVFFSFRFIFCSVISFRRRLNDKKNDISFFSCRRRVRVPRATRQDRAGQADGRLQPGRGVHVLVRPAQDPSALALGRVPRRRTRGTGSRNRCDGGHGEGVRPRARTPRQGHRGARVPLLLAEAGRGVERERSAVAGPGRPGVARRVAVHRHHDRAARVSDGVDQNDQARGGHHSRGPLGKLPVKGRIRGGLGNRGDCVHSTIEVI